MSDKPTLLPPNATPLERALEQALARIEDVRVPVDTLWDPWRCPADLLPWLAWAWSVDEWDAEWPEEVKRRVIAAAPEVHRLKGTRAAVERALRAIGVFAEIVEWWQRSPKGQPGTFSVTAWVNEQLHTGGAVLTERVQRQIDAICRRVKPVSRAYELVVGVLFGAGAWCADAAAAVQVAHRTVEAGRDSRMHGAAAAADAASAMMVAHRSIEAGRDSRLRGAAGAADAMAALMAACEAIEAGRDTACRGALAAADACAAMQIMTMQMEATA